MNHSPASPSKRSIDDRSIDDKQDSIDERSIDDEQDSIADPPALVPAIPHTEEPNPASPTNPEPSTKASAPIDKNEPESPEAKAVREKEAKTKRQIASLQAQIKATEAKIESVSKELEEGKGQLRNPNPQATINNHITLLHDYNAIRDIGTGLFGLIAERRGVRNSDVFREYGLGEGD